MSGGSYNYASLVDDLQDLIEKRYDVGRIAEDLHNEGAHDAAADLETLLISIRTIEGKVEARLWRLQPVMRALEWWRSCDWSEEQFRKAVEEYGIGDV